MPVPDSFSLKAPAKINLWLRILGQRDDGFHSVETRLAPLALADELTLQPEPDSPDGTVRFTCDDSTVPGDESNLVLKAIRALERLTGLLPGMNLHLAKVIPHGAGLGGGSSDAAAALRLVQHVFRPEWADALLREAAAAVGSDVPFFLDGGVADATGRGEIVIPVREFTGTPPVLLVKVPFGVSTPWAYRQWHGSIAVPGLPYAPQVTPWGEFQNDLERPVFEKYQVLGHLKRVLQQSPGVVAALMSGSGSTVFALLKENVDRSALEAAVRDEVGAEAGLWWTRLAPVRQPVQKVGPGPVLDARSVAL